MKLLELCRSYKYHWVHVVFHCSHKCVCVSIMAVQHSPEKNRSRINKVPTRRLHRLRSLC